MSVAGPKTEELLAMARAGDSAALGQLFELYRNYMLLLTRLQFAHRLRGKADASDVVQDAFLDANKRFPQFRGTTEAELVEWLRQILASKLADLARRYLGTRRRDVRLEQEWVDELETSSRAMSKSFAAGHNTPSQRASRREQAVILADSLKTLPDHYAEVIVLRHLEGRSFAEVASRMNRSVDSVEKLWVRALDALRRKLGEP